MQKNVGDKDRLIRLILGAGAFPLLFILSGPAKWIGLASIPLIFTAQTRKCGAYALIGKSTCEIKK